MAEQDTSAGFIERIRAGDEQAAIELVRQYEPLIRREVRLRLEDRGLNRLFDSMDVCQSVMASFFVRAAAGEYDLQQPSQLIKLLVATSRNKLASAARKARRQKRDHRKAAAGDDALALVAAPEPSPSVQVGGKELLERVRSLLTEEENRLAELRHCGASWDEIAQQLGGAAQARRMQLVRALDRAAREVGLEDSGDE
jgi:RNA polymerase sigma-70 factor (ECF subfamily)